MLDLEVYAELGDLKETDYRNTLAIATIIELLIQKGIITRQEFARMASRLDRMTVDEIKILRTR
ncbi:MAG: hypothetical protein N4A57_00085 [Anaeromicrobium sp.]|jgi:hypothetical protein|uniref:hypothetical protein n=1 Tax=Anaeromicrobium sp. TaxID=1929132 RepID=UPI0025F2587B|nr:hypothetical protein [Anaeromicrobium sp.]MCT4592662.1 hypothetical protein [Anaeromicrobium sp.]